MLALRRFAEGAQHLRNIGGVVLSVAVQGCDDFTSGGANAGAHRAALPDIAAVGDDTQRRDFRLEGFQNIRGVILRAVIDEDDLGFGADGAQNLQRQRRDVLRLVLDGHNNGKRDRHGKVPFDPWLQ